MHPFLDAAAARRHGVIGVADLRRAEVSPDQVRRLVDSRAWVRLRRGAFVPADVLAAAEAAGDRHLVDGAAVLLTVDRPAAVLSHASAAAVWGLPGPSPQLVDLTDAQQTRRGTGYRITCSPLPASAHTRERQLPLTGVARTVVDLARRELGPDALAVADAALHRGLTDDAGLAAALDAARGWTGVGAARALIQLADGLAESPLESRCRWRLLGTDLPAPQLGWRLTVDGQHIWPDGWWPAAGVAMECDGRVKYRDPWDGRTTEQKHWVEKRRAEVFAAAGVRFWRVAEPDLYSAAWSRAHTRLATLLSHPPTHRHYTAVHSPRPRPHRSTA